MARKFQLTWNGKSARWFKRFDGKQYAITAGKLKTLYPHLVESETKEGSYRAANAWWEAKEKELAVSPDEELFTQALYYRSLRAKWYELEGQPDERLAVLEEMEFLRRLQSGRKAYPDRKAFPLDPSTVSNSEALTWVDRYEQVKKQLDWTATNKQDSLKDLLTLFLKHKQTEVSPSQLDSLKRYCGQFLDWKGSDRVDDINGLLLASYRDQLLNQKDNGQWTKHAKLKCVKVFVNWLYDTAEVLEVLPRNLRKLSIQIEDKEPTTWTDEQIKTLLSKVTGKQRLYYLLMLNCGMYQGDIGQLRKDQINFEQGTITRKRSKTEGNGGRKVTYKLWPETLALLQANLSDDETLALTTEQNTPLWTSEVREGEGSAQRKTDTIGLQYRRWKQRKEIDLPDLKDLRKTGRNKLETHDAYARYAQYYLAHKPRSVDERYYRSIEANLSGFHRALDWLRIQFLG